MANKAMIITGCALMALSACFTVPILSGTPITLAVGPMSVSYSQETDFEFDLDADCLSDHCPIIEYRVGLPGQEAWRVGF